ncbi:MAG: hypothetical protein ACPG4N_04780, partial [Gammaproteobacteria bacterium]
QGELEQAATQYRENMARWPNDEVAASGLADVYKAQGALEKAAAQYRDNMVSWPRDRVSRNGLGSVLRLQKRLNEALQLVPEPVGLVLMRSDFYDLHLRAMILLDLGRASEAQALLKRGLDQARAPLLRRRFESSLIMVSLRLERAEDARRLLAANSENVISLQVYRLHLAAKEKQTPEAHRLFDELSARRDSLDITIKQALDRMDRCFCFSRGDDLCEPSEEQLKALYDAETEMEISAVSQLMVA